MELKIDNDFKDLIPNLSEEEFKQLEKNCISDGIRDSICIWNNTIIDGHNRYNIAKNNNLEFKIKEYIFDNREKVIEWIILNQFGRRNLTNFQRSELALRLKDYYSKLAKENSGIRTDLNQKSDCFWLNPKS
ncbi:MAG TPA: hypothetical protein PKK13_13100 [Spirochaetota bacterium]|nr:hypothetical protein [Spirochaetota bacterium]